MSSKIKLIENNKLKDETSSLRIENQNNLKQLFNAANGCSEEGVNSMLETGLDINSGILINPEFTMDEPQYSKIYTAITFSLDGNCGSEFIKFLLDKGACVNSQSLTYINSYSQEVKHLLLNDASNGCGPEETKAITNMCARYKTCSTLGEITTPDSGEL
jgi:hypothetical protein